MKPLKTTYLAFMTLILASCEIVLPSVPFSGDSSISSETSSTVSIPSSSSTIDLDNNQYRFIGGQANIGSWTPANAPVMTRATGTNSFSWTGDLYEGSTWKLVIGTDWANGEVGPLSAGLTIIDKGVTWTKDAEGALVIPEDSNTGFDSGLGGVGNFSTKVDGNYTVTFVSLPALTRTFTIVRNDTNNLGYAKQTNPTIDINGYRESSGNIGLPTTGNVKLLVIPVTFTDYRCGNLCATRKEQIRKTFFGNANETSWESVKSYYEKSSYGTLTLTGVVTDWFDSSWSTSQFASLTTTEGEYADAFDPTWAMLDAAIAWYKSYSGSDLTEYDTDFDGFIDSVYLVYNNPNATNAVYSAAGEDVFWAYTYWHYNNYGNQNLSSPVGMTLVWSSFDFMFEGYGVNGLDAHTYIHELGHAFGLDDYYTYSENDWGAAGGLDMMDYNILDHNAFSKYLLGWTNPYVLTTNQTTTTITLNPFESSGDFFLLGNNWNGSAFDNYLIFEFYTPTGLNQKDSAAAYPGNNLRGFTVPGVKIYHVDARLGRYSNSTGAFGGYTDTLNVGFSNYPYIAHSNSVDWSQNENFKLLHLLEESGTNSFIDGEVATNATLFRSGDIFNPTTTHSGLFFNQGGRFNDNSLIGYTVSFSNVTSQSATLTVTKI